ncbi:hypothetical protein GLOIN_2v1584137 [Rhizophagus irregularis DAOM 181602=DAOM 197198]|uniref:Uncharacterized protein n=1 Tax=Rhizophagus irregularis (strain DAOM 181602 / DAOM 197198 / MUCL 43194) TaxID=747089 RepID=A0A2P4Q7N3_RHIID|nr:hypothetical protein GLOIN_2v1584137 [Rhizophagus irregularis DAOM 181602=DAOM 197198]POG73644.1 hypothetical protein GLOIN_2v1584137 [Rhizophagus irregularis DAOM 181602=DAOM 197198]|eukprot:XP_025180510.1 hypothetical protein GLOIN_2v1584137 [Rhizophagus irregularis DAOM 181602=DAOM 197198]
MLLTNSTTYLRNRLHLTILQCRHVNCNEQDTKANKTHAITFFYYINNLSHHFQVLFYDHNS